MGLQHESMGNVNEYLVLEHMAHAMQASRAEISESLGLSQASVSRVVTRLIARGILTETGETTTTAGRPRSVVGFNLDSNCVVGIDLGGTKCHGVVANLAGEVLDEEFILVAEGDGGARTLELMWARLKKKATDQRRSVGAVAIGIPAVIDPSSGLAWRGPNIGWEGFDVGKLVGGFGLPYTIENDVNLAAIAEGEVGQAVGCADFAVISIGTGLGAAIVANGKLIRGRHNSAGEVGYLPHPFLPPSDSHSLNLESVLSGAGLANDAREILKSHPDAAIEFGTEPTGRDVVEAGIAGKPYASELVRLLQVALEEVIVAIAAVTDPEMVIIDGSIGRALAPELDRIASNVRRRLPAGPRVAISDLGPNSTVRGAISAALDRFTSSFSPPILNTLRADRSAL